MDKKIIVPDRIRKIQGSFGFIEHRFLQSGFWSSLNNQEILFYLFLVLVSDRNGISYYSYEKILSYLKISLEEYLLVRDSLIEKKLIAFDGQQFQVLSLPDKPVYLIFGREKND